MKKYLRLATFLAVFLVAVLFRNVKDNGAKAAPPVQLPDPTATPAFSNPTPTPSPAPTSTPSSTPSAGETPTPGSGGLPLATPTPAVTPTPVPATPTPTPGASAGMYKDGTYTGNVAYAYYGYVQVQVTVSGGKITDVQFLQHPDHARTSQRINSQAMPWLTDEAIQAQSANVYIISGASATSLGFRESLGNALKQAVNS